MGMISFLLITYKTNNIILEFSRENTPKRRFENQKPTKTKKQALCFTLLLICFVPGAGQLSNLFLQDLDKLRDFTARLKAI